MILTPIILNKLINKMYLQPFLVFLLPHDFIKSNESQIWAIKQTKLELKYRFEVQYWNR